MDRKAVEDGEDEAPVYRSLAVGASASAAAAEPAAASADLSAAMGLGAGAPRTYDWNDAATESMATFDGEAPVYRSVSFMPPAGALGLGMASPSAAAAPFDPRSLGFAGGASLAPPTMPSGLMPPKPMVRPSYEIAVSSPAGVESSLSQLQVPALPSAPFALERSHFYVVGSALSVASLLDEELRRLDVQSEFKPLKAKWKSVLRTATYQEISFRVKLFMTRTSRLVVEFQLRRGDGVAYNRTYRAMRQALVAAGVVCNHDGVLETTTTAAAAAAAGPSILAGLAPPPLPSMATGMDVAEAQLDAQVEPLKRMAESVCADTALEGLRGVAQLAKVELHQEALERVGIVPVLAQRLRSQDATLRRVALAAAANMAQLHTARTALVANAALEPMANMLAASDVDMQRHSAHALRLLVEEHGAAIAEFRGAMRLQETLDRAVDAGLRSDVGEIIARTQACR